MRITSLSLIVLLLTAMALPALAQDEVEFPITLTDDSGVELTLEEPVENILCLSIACLDHLYQLGLQPAGITDLLTLPYEQYFGEVDDDLTIIEGGMQPDIEQIAAMQPELVIGQAGFFDPMREAMADIAPMFLIYPRDVEHTLGEVEAIGMMTGRVEEAQAAIDDFNTLYTEYQEAAETEAGKTVMIVFGAAEGDAMFLEASNGQTCLLFDGIAECPFEIPEGASGPAAFGYDNFTFESILAADPDVIFFAGYNEDRSATDSPLQALEDNELWLALSAVQNEAVYGIEPWMWRGGRGLTLMTLTLEQALPALYPEAFED